MTIVGFSAWRVKQNTAVLLLKMRIFVLKAICPVVHGRSRLAHFLRLVRMTRELGSVFCFNAAENRCDSGGLLVFEGRKRPGPLLRLHFYTHTY